MHSNYFIQVSQLWQVSHEVNLDTTSLLLLFVCSSTPRYCLHHFISCEPPGLSGDVQHPNVGFDPSPKPPVAADFFGSSVNGEILDCRILKIYIFFVFRVNFNNLFCYKVPMCVGHRQACFPLILFRNDAKGLNLCFDFTTMCFLRDCILKVLWQKQCWFLISFKLVQC